MACVKTRNGRLVLDFYDQRGRRVMQRLPEGTTKGKAQTKLAEIIMQLERGNFVTKQAVSTFKTVADDWLKIKGGLVRHTTHGTYEKMLRLYILPFMGHLPINRVTVATIEKFVPHVKDEYPEKRMIWDAEAKYRNRKELIEKYPTLEAYIAHRKIEGFKKDKAESLVKKKIWDAEAKYRKSKEFIEKYPTLAAYIAYRKMQGFNMDAVPAPASFKKMLDVIGQVMNFAVKRRMIDFNPVTLADRPKMKKKREAEFLQPHEIRAMLDHALEGKYRTIFLVAVLTGLRQGELLGLQWNDVDWMNKQVCVNRTYNHGKFMDPKSKASCRRVDLAPVVVAELKKWKLQGTKSELDLVFPNDAGGPMEAMNLLHRGYYPALRRAGLRHVCFHSLRHTFASLHIDNDVNLKYLQQQMGHSSINVTLDTYSHLLKPTNQQAAVKLEKTVFEENGKLLVNFSECGQ